MSRSFALILTVVLAGLTQDPVAGQDRLASSDRIKDLGAHFEGKISIYAKNLKTGATYDLGGSNRVNTASTIKLPIMIAVFTEAAAGRVHWTDTSELTKDSKVAGSGVLQELSEGTRIPLRDLLRYMILLSDNTATNLVLDHVTGNTVNDRDGETGIEDTRSLRKILNGSTPEGVSDAGRDT